MKNKGKQLTKELINSIKTDTPYSDDMPSTLLPYEPYVKVDKVIGDYDNYRSFKGKDGKLIIPIAKYIDGCRASYTLFNEVKEWSDIYGIKNVFVGVISDLMPVEANMLP